MRLIKIICCLFCLLLFFSCNFLLAQDTLATKKGNNNVKPFIMLECGGVRPWTFSGYGANSFYPDYDGYGYSGYANPGFIVTATGGIDFGHGLEYDIRVALIHNQMDASGV